MSKRKNYVARPYVKKNKNYSKEELLKLKKEKAKIEIEYQKKKIIKEYQMKNKFEEYDIENSKSTLIEFVKTSFGLTGKHKSSKTKFDFDFEINNIYVDLFESTEIAIQKSIECKKFGESYINVSKECAENVGIIPFLKNSIYEKTLY